MGGKGQAKKIPGFCNALNIKFCLVLDRDSMITTEGSDIKAICRYLKGENEPKSCRISDFLDKEFDEFSHHLAKEEKMFIWKHGELEDFLLSESKKSLKICEILSPGLKKKRENSKPNTESNENEIKYEKMKSIITNALVHALSRDTLDELADETIDFTETDRLLSFLKDK